MTKEIENITKALKSKNSPGYDEMATKILKVSSPFINPPLNYTCNKTLSKGICPDGLKYLITKPLYRYLIINKYHF
jgi:hypothetical protein